MLKVPNSLEQKVIKIESLQVGEPRILYGIHHIRTPGSYLMVVRQFTRTSDKHLKRDNLVRGEDKWIIVSSTNLTLGSYRDSVFFENESDCQAMIDYLKFMDALTND